MNKRYVLFIGTMNKGGAQRVMSILARTMAENGHDITLLVYYDSEFLYEVNSRVKTVIVEKETGTKNLFKNLIWIRGYFKANADTVVSFLTPFNMIAVCALFFLKIPVVVSERNDPRLLPSSKHVRRLRDILYRFANRVVVQTENNKVYFSEPIQKKCDVIANPIDIGDKHGQALDTQKEKKIVTAGRLTKEKNHPLLIKSFAQIHKEFPEYRLVIYGEGNYRSELEKLVSELDLQAFVSLPGNQLDIFDKISDAELFVLSSDCEGMPNALLEAMCLGLPVISTKVSGASEIIENEENGLLVDVASQEQMTSAIRKMLSDEEFCAKCAKNAMKIADGLSVEKIYKQWMDTLKNGGADLL